MTKGSVKKKYHIISSFTYKGHDGKSKRPVRICPGEELPKLDENEIVRLLSMDKIAEISKETGEIIKSDKSIRLTGEEIDKFLQKSPNAVAQALKSLNFSTETLGQMTLLAQKNGMPDVIVTLIDDILNKRIASD